MNVSDKRIYLASRSPRRRELLKQIGIGFELLLLREDSRRGLDVDETPREGEQPLDYVERIARAKAWAGAQRAAQRSLLARPVLAADTTVVLDGSVIGKPRDAGDAARILTALQGRTHQVITAVAVALRDRLESSVSVSSVEFAPLSRDEIARYLATGEPFDKAGAYAIQGRAAVFVKRIEGSYSGIMGLPLAETAELLKRFGIDAP
jgi:septum formation protein